MTHDTRSFIFYTGSLEDTDKYIEAADGHHVTAKQKGQVRIKICDDNGDTFIATLHNVILAPDLCDKLFSIINLMNSGNTCLFYEWFCTVNFGAKKNNAVTLPHNAQRKHAYLGKIRDMSKKKKLPARNRIALDFLHLRLGHRSAKPLLDGDTANVWEDIELKIDPDHFVTSYQISSMNKKAKSKIPHELKAPFKWVFMDIIPSTASKSLTSDTTFLNIFSLLMPTPKLQNFMV